MSAQISILYVEDEFLIREMTALALEEAGFRVVVAASGADAIGALRAAREPISAIVTDVNLGDGPDGWEVARHGRAWHRDLPVVYLSGAIPGAWRDYGVANSILLGKPFRIAQIAAAIRSLSAKARATRTRMIATAA